MNNNSGKQVMLSVLGIAVLVVAVVGVSFAFFTYSRTGTQNNVISSGNLSFAFADGNFINLENHFPISTEQGLKLTGEGNVCDFTITGYITNGSITYDIFAVPGDKPEGKETSLRDSEVFVNIKRTGTAPTGMTFTSATLTDKGEDTGKAISTLAGETGMKKLGTGTVTATSAVTSTFEVRMWVDSSVVKIGAAKTDTYTTDAYGNLYYAMKILVKANA